MVNTGRIEKLSQLLRYYILISTTEAGSGHPTSSLSAVELMACLFFGDVFRFDVDNPGHSNNDRLIFSKGHASPLFYALWTAAGKVTEQEIITLRKFGSPFKGHTTTVFPYVEAYQKRVSSFGWETILVDGHSISEILSAYGKALQVRDKPVMIIARTIKGKGVSFLEDQENWHGKALKKEELALALQELGTVDRSVRGEILKPEDLKPERQFSKKAKEISYPEDKPIATRKAYGNTLARIFPQFPDIVVLDAEVCNSTYSEIFKEKYPELFFEMYIAEQNMVGTALGLSCRGKIPFISTFAAFFSRAFDQIRMCQYTSHANIKFAGSHAGVSIGEDGP